MRILILLCLLCCLSSCGFKPRGTQPLNPKLQTLYLKTSDPYGQLSRNLRDYLVMTGVILTDSPKGVTTLQILSETESQQLINVSGTQQTRQYNLVLTVNFQLLNARGEPLTVPQTLSETRAFTTLSNQILGGTNEQNTLMQQMRQAIVFDIMNRLSSQDITSQLAKP